MASQPKLSRFPVMLPLAPDCLPLVSAHSAGMPSSLKLQHGQNVSMFACFAFLCRMPHGV